VKGIILAGGTGSRLQPITLGVSKQLLPVYDKPMIYFPLSTLMLMGLREIMVITTPHDQAAFQRLLGDGAHLGIAISWMVQEHPAGLAQALLLGEEFLDGDKCALILGDNLFYGPGLGRGLQQFTDVHGAMIFAHEVSDPERYGVVEFADDGRVISIEEKPSHPKSNFAVPGLYFYDEKASALARELTPSPRGELEITDLNLAYMRRGELRAVPLSRATSWFDTGTYESLYEAGGFIRAVQSRTGQKIADVEQIARDFGWIS
jgi:glucose-1-phosphate thymidylyltransferase